MATIDLASASAWTCKGETDAAWTTIKIPGQKGAGNQRWMDFRRTLSIPNISPKQSAVLRFLSVNEGGIIYIDNALVDTIYYSIFPAEVDITHFVKPGGTHTLTVKCFNRSKYTNGVAYIANGYTYGKLGMPRGAFLEIHPEVRIGDVFIQPSVAADNFRSDLWITNRSSLPKTITIKGRLSPWNQGDAWNYPIIPDQSVTIPANSTRKVAQNPVHWGLGSKSYWWPNIPFEETYAAKLHYLNLSLYEGSVKLDTMSQRFGFVEYSEGPYYYKVNGVHVFQPGDGTQESHFPGGTQYGYVNTEGWGPGPKGAKETWRRYLRLGMNSFRVHISAATDVMCDAADEVGFMLIPATAVLGESSLQESWHPVFKPEAVRGMVRFQRKHPSTARYSLTNEWYEATRNSTIYQGLIDAVMSEDTTRPMSFSQDNAPFDIKLNGTNGIGHAWVISHYREPADDTTKIRGIEEMFWPNKNNDAGFERLDCARAAILYRMRHYAVFHPWCWNNYWGNFVAGNSGGNNRTDGKDGWGSKIVKFIQNCYHVYASADVDIITNKISNNENDYFPVGNAYAFQNAKTTTRKMVMFNNSLSGHVMRIRWETRLDSANGMLVGIGATDTVTVGAGDFVQPSIELPLPGTNSAYRTLHFVVKTEVDGAIKFTEDQYILRVSNPGQPQVVSLAVPAAIRRLTAPAPRYKANGEVIREGSGSRLHIWFSENRH